MTRITLSPALRAELHDLAELLEVCDESGRTLGYFHPAIQGAGSGRIASPISDEKIEELRKQRTGRPLAEILKDLPSMIERAGATLNHFEMMTPT